LREIKKPKGSGETPMKFKDSTNVLSRPVENHMALKALLTNIINLSILKYTRLFPTSNPFFLYLRNKRKKPKKNN
jgi:hypothetical protein